MFSLDKDLKESRFLIDIYEVPSFLNDEEIKILNDFASQQNKLKAFSGERADHHLDNQPVFLNYEEPKLSDENKSRQSNVVWIFPESENIRLLYKKIISKIIEVNEQVIKYNLTDLEVLQYTIYNKGQYYKKHVDAFPTTGVGNLTRKLSFSIQLSDPADYEGGELLVYHSEKPVIASKQKGTLIFFSSFMLHEAKVVTKGKRTSLVGWVHGPRFV